MNKTALVTGCAGFIGSHLTEALIEAGYTVLGIDCFRDYYNPIIKEQNISGFIDNPDFTLIRQDICSMKSFPEVDYVFHLAAQAGVRASWGSSFDQYTHDNITATQRLLEGYKDKKSLKKFIYSSSSSVYGNAPVYPVTEDVMPQPISPYGVTKLAGEHLCHLYFTNYGLPAVSLRYFTVYGPRQRPDMAINKFMRAIIEGKEIHIYGDGTQMRDFTYVGDIVNASLSAQVNGKNGKVYNVGGGEKISISSLVSKIEKILKKTTKKSFEPAQYGDVKETWADTRYLRCELKWEPKVSVDKGLDLMAQWFLKNRNNNE